MVSTDYDTRIVVFRTLTFEDVMSVLDRESSAGRECPFVQWWPDSLNSFARASAAGVKISYGRLTSIELAEDRRDRSIALDLGIPPASGLHSREQRAKRAQRSGFRGCRASVVRAGGLLHGTRDEWALSIVHGRRHNLTK